MKKKSQMIFCILSLCHKPTFDRLLKGKKQHYNQFKEGKKRMKESKERNFKGQGA